MVSAAHPHRKIPKVSPGLPPQSFFIMALFFQCESSELEALPWVPEVFSRVRGGAFAGCRPQADMSSADEGRRNERRSGEKKPLAQSALIYHARWTLTLSLICQSNRRFPTVITCTSKRMKWQIWILLQYLSQLSDLT